ncbi:MAG: nickel pincer cofactor biosynthesis protein LarC [Actinobacteria bacterium]|nr:nickel pincer cofactor biosynthesis protein LarC [Actinomycetota bacterium]
MTPSAPDGQTRLAWFNCQAGVAGDMTMAALVDAGADPHTVGHTIAGLGIDGYALTFERVQRCGVGATWANVLVHQHDENQDHAHRPVSEIYELLDRADLPQRVRVRATSVFRQLADVEGAIHGVAPNDVELHEVGALDAIVDVVGVCAALESLAIDEIRCSPVALGTGTITSAHGMIPNPAPATAALLAAAAAPVVGLDTTLEVTTPTGAALMTALSAGFGAAPTMTPSTVGYGAGTADVAERANVVQVLIGERAADVSEQSSEGSDVVLLEANVDDVTGEVLAHTVSVLLAMGAHDAWTTPIVMKKGRPAHTVSALCDPSSIDAIRHAIVIETGTLGIRASTLKRWPQRRSMTSVDVEGHQIGVKISDHRIKVEFDDAARAAQSLGLPVRIVLDRASAAAANSISRL